MTDPAIEKLATLGVAALLPSSNLPATKAKKPVPLAPSDISAKGLAFILREEGYRARPYNDSADNATIGVGHLLHYGPVTVKDRVRYALGLSRSAALDLLRQDAARFVAHIKERAKAGKWHLTQPMFDALVSLTFNCGSGALDGGIARALDKGDLRGATVVMLQWNSDGHAPVLLPRRRREVELFLHGNYGA